MSTIEILTFQLAAHTTESAFLAADRRLQTEVMYHQPGLLRRTTARDQDGGWVVIAHWGSAADAEQATRLAASESATSEFDALLDATSVTRRHYETLD